MEQTQFEKEIIPNEWIENKVATARRQTLEEVKKVLEKRLEKCEYCKKIVDVECLHYDHFGNQALNEALKEINQILSLLQETKPTEK